MAVCGKDDEYKRYPCFLFHLGVQAEERWLVQGFIIETHVTRSRLQTAEWRLFMKKIFVKVLAAAAAVSMALAGCKGAGGGPQGGATVNADRVLNISVDVECDTTDVQKTTEYFMVPLNIYDTLVRVEVKDGVSEIVPSLAEDWEVSDDGLVYTFYLRKGVKFHNGEELKADDVLFTFERMLNPDTGAKNQDFISAIAGAKDMMDGSASNLSGFEQVDNYTFKLTLEAPFAPFLANLSTPGASIYNRKATSEAGEDFGLLPEKTIGTGPFKFTEWVLNSSKTLTANEDYWGGRPALDSLYIQVVEDPDTMKMMFDNGEIDIFDGDYAPSQLSFYLNNETYKDQIIIGDRLGIYYLSINEKLEPFEDVRVRKALQMAIDKQTILNTVFNGLGTVQSGIMPPGLIGHNPELPEISYDPEGAKALLAEAGYPDGFEMTISQSSDNGTAIKQVYEIIQAMLAEVGIQAEIETVDDATWYAVRADGELGAYFTSWSADFNDPDNFLYTFFAPENTVKRSFNYSNEAASKRVVEARAITDPEKRIAEYQELEKLIIQDDAAWVPLFSKQHVFVVNPRVQGFTPSWNGWSDNRFAGVSILQQ